MTTPHHPFSPLQLALNAADEALAEGRLGTEHVGAIMNAIEAALAPLGPIPALGLPRVEQEGASEFMAPVRDALYWCLCWVRNHEMQASPSPSWKRELKALAVRIANAARLLPNPQPMNGAECIVCCLPARHCKNPLYHDPPRASPAPEHALFQYIEALKIVYPVEDAVRRDIPESWSDWLWTRAPRTHESSKPYGYGIGGTECPAEVYPDRVVCTEECPPLPVVGKLTVMAPGETPPRPPDTYARNISDVAYIVERIKAMAGDYEAAHYEERELYLSVLRAIASGKVAPTDAREMARIAVTADEIEFTRYFA